MDQRKDALTAWARQCLQDMAGGLPLEGSIHTVSGDASFRRYFRIVLPAAPGSADPLWQALLQATRYILVDAPPAHEDCRRFVRVAQLFRAAGMLTPRVLRVDFEQGFMLLEDFGDALYLPALQTASGADALYTAAINSLIELQARGNGSELAPYNRQLLRTEMSLFDHWFCERFLEIRLNDDERALLERTWTFLEDAALTQPQVCVHRDYHSRNLMVLDGDVHHAPGVIDFQDAVFGACTYDLVSLLRDCYIVWPDARVRAWALQYRAGAVARGVLAGTGPSAEAAFLRDFDLMGLQRHIKVIGIFCRLNLRDGKPRYMADVPLVIDYVLRVAAGHPEMAEFNHWFQNRVLPVAYPRLQAFALPEGIA